MPPFWWCPQALVPSPAESPGRRASARRARQTVPLRRRQRRRYHSRDQSDRLRGRAQLRCELGWRSGSWSLFLSRWSPLLSSKLVSSNYPFGLYSLLQLGTFLAHWMFEAQDSLHRLDKPRDAVVGHDLLPPSHMGVGPHQYAAALGHLPQARPVIVEVEHLAARADHEAGDLHAHACGDLLRRLFPGLTSHASEEGESALTHQVQRADGLSGVPQPAVGQPRSRPGGGVVVELGVMGIGGLGRPIGDHGRRVVALIELDAVAVELIVLEFDGLAQFLPLLGAMRRVLFSRLHACTHLLDAPGLAEPEGLVDRAEFLYALVRAPDNLLANGRPLIVVGLQQRWVRLSLQHQGELPGEVVGVLDGGVRAEPVGRRMPVDGITHAEHAPVRVARCVQVVDAPERRGADLDWDGVVADQGVRDSGCRLVVDVGWGIVDVVAPNDEPFVPGTHHADGAHPDTADVGAGLQHPVEYARSVGNVFREVGRENDVHAAGDVHLPLQGQADVLGDHAASTVSAEQVPGPDLIGAPADTVAHRRGHAIGVLLEREVLGVETDPRPAGGGLAEKDRLHQSLRAVADARRARERIVRHPTRVRAPRT